MKITVEASTIRQLRSLLEQLDSVARPKDRDIRTLGLSARVKNCLLAGGIETAEQLATKSFADLNRIPNFGKHSWNEVRDVLLEAGFIDAL